jgi:hypothetical protein
MTAIAAGDDDTATAAPKWSPPRGDVEAQYRLRAAAACSVLALIATMWAYSPPGFWMQGNWSPVTAVLVPFGASAGMAGALYNARFHFRMAAGFAMAALALSAYSAVMMVFPAANGTHYMCSSVPWTGSGTMSAVMSDISVLFSVATVFLLYRAASITWRVRGFSSEPLHEPGIPEPIPGSRPAD